MKYIIYLCLTFSLLFSDLSKEDILTEKALSVLQSKNVTEQEIKHFVKISNILRDNKTDLAISSMNGEEFLKLSSNAQMATLSGLYHALSISNDMDFQSMGIAKLYSWNTQGMSWSQINAIFVKRLKENPKGWHNPIVFLFREALETPGVFRD